MIRPNETTRRALRAPLLSCGLLLAIACGGGQHGTTTPDPDPEPTAIELLRQRAHDAPDDAALQRELLLAELLEEGGESARWESQAARAVETSPSDATVRYFAAHVAQRHGHPAAALEGHLATLELAARARTPEATLVAELSASELGELSGLAPGFPETVRPRVEALLQQPGGLGPQARYLLTEVLSNLAYRRGDIETVRALAAQYGCAESYTVAGPFGPRVMLGFGEAPAAAGAGAMGARYDLGPDRGERPSRTLQASPCSVNLGDAAELRASGASVAETFVEVPTAGSYWIRLGTHSAMTLSVDGREVARHDGRRRLAPSVTYHEVQLTAGRHEIETVVWARHPNPFLSVSVMPVSGPAPGGASSAAPTFQATPEPGDTRLSRYLAASVLLGRGDALSAREIIRVVPNREAGVAWLSLAASVAGSDPFLPSDVRRDNARVILRRVRQLNPSDWETAYMMVRLTAAEGRPQEALAEARRLVEQWPEVAPLKLLLVDLVVDRGWDADADRLIAEARAAAPGTCGPIAAELSGAQRRDRTQEIDRLIGELMACNGRSDARFSRLLQQRRWDQASAELDRLAALEASQTTDTVLELRLDLARGRGDTAEIERLVAELRRLRPRSAALVLEQADRLFARGRRDQSLSMLDEALAADRVAMSGLLWPRRAIYRQDDMADFRLDGAQVIRDFEASGREYTEPQVLVLDYTAVRVFPDRSRLVLTHNIVKLQSDEAIDQQGQFGAPEGAALLTLRTVKADGTHLEPDLMENMDTISMPNLEVGDYIEFEMVQYIPPPGGYPNGLLGNGFYFRTYETPYDRTEMVVAVPRSLGDVTVVPRGPAPETQRTQQGDLDVYRWRLDESRPYEREPGSVSLGEFTPSIHWGIGATWEQLFETVLDELSDKELYDPAARRIARRIVRGAETDIDRARRLYDWVLENIEAARGGVLGQAGVMLASRRGDRLRVLKYLLDQVDVPAALVLSRNFTEDPTQSPLPDTDTYSDLLLRVGEGNDAVYLSAYARGVPFGYVPVVQRGQEAVLFRERTVERVRIPQGAEGIDRREVDIAIQLHENGSATLTIQESYRGAGAISWRTDLEGIPAAELESRFEEAYVARMAPGADVHSLNIEGREERDQPFVMTYSFDVPRIGRIQDGRWVMPPMLFGSLAQRYAQASTRTTTQLVAPNDAIVRMRVTAPRGAPAPRGPRAASLTFTNGARVAIDSTTEGDTVVVTRSIRVPLSRVEASDYEAFATFCRQADEALTQETFVPLPRR